MSANWKIFIGHASGLSGRDVRVYKMGVDPPELLHSSSVSGSTEKIAIALPDETQCMLEVDNLVDGVVQSQSFKSFVTSAGFKSQIENQDMTVISFEDLSSSSSSESSASSASSSSTS